MEDRRRTVVFLLIAVGLVGAVGVFSLPPIPQDPGYHRFADERALLGLPNFFNVVSNLAFVVAGGLGMRAVTAEIPARASPAREAFIVFFLATGLLGITSSYYHAAPSNGNLVWDRLALAVAMMALFSAVIGEYVGTPWGRLLLGPLVLAGVASVFYWAWTEHLGRGDLRLYALVQFLPMILIPIVVSIGRSHFTRGFDYIGALALYGLAKLAEYFDAALYAFGYLVSGHTVKHLLAAFAVYWLVRMLGRRARTVPAEGVPPITDP